MNVTSSPPQLHHFTRQQTMHTMNTNWSSNSMSPFSSPNSNSRLSPHLPRQRAIPRLRSNLSTVDSKFVELTRCLYQAKTIVQDLSSFHASVLPMLSLSTYHDPAHSPNSPHLHPFASSHQQKVGSVAFHQHIKEYLNDNFSKFTKLCKILMMILARLEQNPQVRQERVLSFRNEILEEWRVANDIKRRILTYLQQNNSLFDGSSGAGASSPPMNTLDHQSSS